MENKDDFTQGGILLPLVRFSVPIFFAVFLQAMYGAADLLIVGRFTNSAGVSAVATGSQCMQTITGIITGLTTGVTVYISKKLGEKHYGEASGAIGTAVWMFAFIGIVITVFILLFTKKLALIMNIPEEAFSGMTSYVRICSLGTIFIVAYNLIGGIMRGLGNSKLPLLFVFVACIANIIGDTVLVGVFSMGPAGAAIATVAAQGISVAFALFTIKRRGLGITISAKDFAFSKKYMSALLHLGVPLALQDALVNVSFLMLTAIVNSLGVIFSAAVGVGEKVVIFIMLIPISYMSSVSAIVARNIGAGKPDRAKKCLYTAMGTSIIFGVLMASVSFFRGDVLAGIFSNDSEVVAACALYMRSYAIDCLLVSFLFCFVGYFNGCGKTIFVLVQSIASSFLIRIPFSYLMSKRPSPNLFMIGLASPLSTVAALAACIVYFRILQKNASEDEK